MKRVIFFLAGLIAIHQATAQQRVIDSLMYRLAHQVKADTNRLKTLLDLAFYLKDTDPAAGIRRSDEAIHLATALHDTNRLASAYNYKALNYSSEGNDSVALAIFDLAIRIRTSLKDQKGTAALLHNKAISYFNLSEYPKAFEIHEQAYTIFQRISDTYGMASSLNSMGNISLYLADYPGALERYFKALKIYEKQHDQLNMGIAYTNIGLVYQHLSSLDTALAYQTKALAIFEKAGHKYQTQNVLTNVGNIYDEMGKHPEALASYQKARQINLDMNNNRGLASNFVNTAIVYNGMKDYDASLEYLQKGLALYQQLDDRYGMSIALGYMANAYLHAEDKILKRYGIEPGQRNAQAVSTQQKSIQLAKEAGNLSEESDGWKQLSDMYAAMKNYPAALSAFQQHAALHDSIFNSEKKSEITRVTMQYDFDKQQAAARAVREKEQAVAAAAISSQRSKKNLVIAATVLLLMSGVVVFIFYKRKRDAVDLQKEAEYKAQVIETEMKALRAQMNPHFIFNSLNSISDYLYKNDVEKADRYLAKFAKMMRMILENSEYRQISLATDLEALELYMQLEALRLGGTFEYETIIEPGIDPHNTMVPPLILQPFVENSIWHGFAHKKTGGKITIHIGKKGEFLHCTITDNGDENKDMPERFNAKQKSMGMGITQSRLRLLDNGRLKGKVVRSRLAEGMRVDVSLPVAVNF